MDMEKLTERARGFLQAAQTIAIREENQRVVPEHLLKALMDDDQGLAANLITRSGGDARAVAQAATEAVGKLPKVQGGDGQVYVDPSLVRVLGGGRPGSAGSAGRRWSCGRWTLSVGSAWSTGRRPRR